MEFDLDDEQRALRDGAKRCLEREAGIPYARRVPVARTVRARRSANHSSPSPSRSSALPPVAGATAP